MALQVYEVALEAVEALAPIVREIAKHDRALADQLRRAASSMVLNIAEADRSDPGNSRARFHTAAGSTSETRAALRLATAWGYLPATAHRPADTLLDRLTAMLWRLLHPAPARLPRPRPTAPPSKNPHSA